MRQLPGRWNRELVVSMITPSLKCWFTRLGSLLMVNSDQFFVAEWVGTAAIPGYRAAYLICINLYGVAVGVSMASSVFVSHLWESDRREQVRQLVRRNIRLGMLVMLCGVAAIVVSGEDLFNVWLSRGHFPGYPLLIVFAAILTLEAHSFMVSTASRATEDEAFAWSSLSSGILKLILAYFLIRRFGLLGLACSTLIAASSISHWYVPYRGLRRLQIPMRDHLVQTLLPVLGAFACALLGSSAVKQSLVLSGVWIRLVAINLVCGLTLAISAYFLALDAGQRQRVLRRIPLLASTFLG
jgi:O-antigen/teichoic acid export membrane protein